MIRVVLYENRPSGPQSGGTQWMAQGLEHDITAHGDTETEALMNFERLVLEKIRGQELSAIPRAPEEFFLLWTKARPQHRRQVATW